MIILKTVLMYILAIFLVAGSGLFMFPFLIITRKLLTINKFLGILINGIAQAIGHFFVVFLITWIASLMSVEASYLMILVPMILMTGNNSRRINEAKRGTSTVARMAGENYDHALHIKQEYIDSTMGLVGLIAGIVVFLKSAPLF